MKNLKPYPVSLPYRVEIEKFSVYDYGYDSQWLHLLKKLEAHESAAAKGAMKKLCGQLWYLSEKLPEFAFLVVSWHVREKSLIEALSLAREMQPPKKIYIDPSQINKKGLGTWWQIAQIFFQSLFILDSFLSVDLDIWSTKLNHDFKQAEDIVRDLRRSKYVCK